MYYATLADLITSLEDAQVSGRSRAAFGMLSFPALMIIDEIGYLPISRTGAMLFFQLMSRRYEHASTVLTSNKAFDEWGEIFGDESDGRGADRSAGPSLPHRQYSRQ